MCSDLLVSVIYFTSPLPLVIIARTQSRAPLGAFEGAQELPMRAKVLPGTQHWYCENVSDQVIRGAECPGWECKQITHHRGDAYSPSLNSPHPGHHYYVMTDLRSLSSAIFSPASQNFENKPDGLGLGWMLNGPIEVGKVFLLSVAQTQSS